MGKFLTRLKEAHQASRTNWNDHAELLLRERRKTQTDKIPNYIILSVEGYGIYARLQQFKTEKKK